MAAETPSIPSREKIDASKHDMQACNTHSTSNSTFTSTRHPTPNGIMIYQDRSVIHFQKSVKGYEMNYLVLPACVPVDTIAIFTTDCRRRAIQFHLVKGDIRNDTMSEKPDNVGLGDTKSLTTITITSESNATQQSDEIYTLMFSCDVAQTLSITYHFLWLQGKSSAKLVLNPPTNNVVIVADSKHSESKEEVKFGASNSVDVFDRTLSPEHRDAFKEHDFSERLARSEFEFDRSTELHETKTDVHINSTTTTSTPPARTAVMILTADLRISLHADPRLTSDWRDLPVILCDGKWDLASTKREMPTCRNWWHNEDRSFHASQDKEYPLVGGLPDELFISYKQASTTHRTPWNHARTNIPILAVPIALSVPKYGIMVCTYKPKFPFTRYCQVYQSSAFQIPRDIIVADMLVRVYNETGKHIRTLDLRDMDDIDDDKTEINLAMLHGVTLAVTASRADQDEFSATILYKNPTSSVIECEVEISKLKFSPMPFRIATWSTSDSVQVLMNDDMLSVFMLRLTPTVGHQSNSMVIRGLPALPVVAPPQVHNGLQQGQLHYGNLHLWHGGQLPQQLQPIAPPPQVNQMERRRS